MQTQSPKSPFAQWKERAELAVSQLRETVSEQLREAARGPRPVGALGLSIERQVQDLTNELGLALMREVFEWADTSSSEVTISGERWGYRRVQTCTYETVFGEATVARSTYQIAGRGRVGVPLDLRLGIVEQRYTPLVARIANRSLASMPTAEAEELLTEVGVCKLSRSTLHRLPQAIAAKAGPHLDVIEEQVRLTDTIPSEARTVQVALDGVMVPMEGPDAKPRGRKCETPAPARHETKYGAQRSERRGGGKGVRAANCAEQPANDAGDADDPTRSPDPDTEGRSWREAAVGTVSFWDKDGEHLKTIYVGQMPSFRKSALVERVEREFRAVMQLRPDLRVELASDGAHTQWQELRAMAVRVLGPDGKWTEMLDFFHCSSRLVLAATAIWGTGEEAKAMSEMWKVVLRERTRGATAVLRALEHQRRIASLESTKTALTKAMNYITHHKKQGRLDYAAAKAQKLPIGTGVTEAAAKTLVSVRMKRSGARYTDHGGQTILNLRAALLSRRFDALSHELEALYTAKVAA